MDYSIGYKIKDKIICPHCGSSNTNCLGGCHYVKTGKGMGHEETKTGYQCNDCKSVFIA